MTNNNRTKSTKCKEPTIQGSRDIIIDSTDIDVDAMHKDEKQAFSDRLNAILDKAGFAEKGTGRQTELGKLLGVSQRGARKWLEAEAIPGVSTYLPEIIRKFADYGASMEWLLMGNPDFDPDHPKNRRLSDDIGSVTISILRKLNVVGAVDFDDNDRFSNLQQDLSGGFIVFPIKNSNAYAMRCSGDGMAPRIKNGEFVIVDANKPVNPGDEVLIESIDGGLKIKTLLYERDGMLYLMSVNNSHALSIASDTVKAMHPIAAIVKKSLWIPEPA